MINVVISDIGASFLKIGGGLTKSHSFCQLLADICGIQVQKGNTEATAIGVGRLAGEMAGVVLTIPDVDENIFNAGCSH